ncbi:hypothetical protein STTU_2800 [Streptomyces sp. Tu6071]|nr:hypothetical protein STTU_2800 [Streptomyces sp. Tu6071]
MSGALGAAVRGSGVVERKRGAAGGGERERAGACGVGRGPG